MSHFIAFKHQNQVFTGSFVSSLSFVMLGQSLFMTNYWIVTVHYQNYIIRHTIASGSQPRPPNAGSLYKYLVLFKRLSDLVVFSGLIGSPLTHEND